jgi:hypothetical protein
MGDGDTAPAITNQITGGANGTIVGGAVFASVVPSSPNIPLLGRHPYRGIEIYDHFTNSVFGNLDWTEVLNSGTIGVTTGTALLHGIGQLTTSTSATAAPSVHLGTNQIILGGRYVGWESNLSTPTLSTAIEEFKVRAGLHNSITSTAPSHGVYFEYDRATSGDFWICKTRASNVETSTVTTLPATAAVYRALRIEVNKTGTEVKFFADGVLIATHTTNIPLAGAIGPSYQIIKSVGTTSRSLNVDWFLFQSAL